MEPLSKVEIEGNVVRMNSDVRSIGSDDTAFALELEPADLGPMDHWHRGPSLFIRTTFPSNLNLAQRLMSMLSASALTLEYLGPNSNRDRYWSFVSDVTNVAMQVTGHQPLRPQLARLATRPLVARQRCLEGLDRMMSEFFPRISGFLVFKFRKASLAWMRPSTRETSSLGERRNVQMPTNV